NIDPPADSLERSRSLQEADRSHVAVHNGRLVANVGAYTRRMAVPGGTLPVTHVTFVAVLPTYRRRGLLRRLIEMQLREVRTAGREPIAALWASEGRIYQRFGYGLASHSVHLRIEDREISFRPDAPVGAGTLRM